MRIDLPIYNIPSESIHDSIDFRRRFGILTLCVAVFISTAFSVLLMASWKNYKYIDDTAGVWTAAAIDASHGILYRPIESNLGYGGTRYAPLHIVLQAGLIRLGLGPVASGYLLDFACIIAVVAGMYALMRQLDVDRLVAAGMATFVLSAFSYASTVAGIKADMLAAAFNIWGLAAIAWSEKSALPRPGILLGGAGLFVLAWAAKVTSIFGLVAAAIWLLSLGRRRQTAILCAAWAVGAIIVALLTEWASGGRALAIFRLCAAGGGGLPELVRGPYHMIDIVVHNDRRFAIFWVIAAGCILMSKKWLSLPALLLVITTLGTIAIFGSPGTNANHLLDLVAATILVIATSVKFGRLGLLTGLAATLIAGYGGISYLKKVPNVYDYSAHSQMVSALADADKSAHPGPLLSENPMLPILEGENPYMIDSFMFRTARMRQPDIANRFWTDLSQRHFRAVILNGAPTQTNRNGNSGNFGPGFIDALQQHYVLEARHGTYWVYLPAPR